MSASGHGQSLLNWEFRVHSQWESETENTCLFQKDAPLMVLKAYQLNQTLHQ